MKNLIQRTITGIIYVAVIVGSICVHPLIFTAVFSIITGLLIYECLTLIKYEGWKWQKILGIAGGMYLFASVALYAGEFVGKIIFLLYILIIMIIAVSELYSRNKEPVMQLSKFLFTQVYCAGFLSLICFMPYKTGSYEPELILMIFIFIWLNDTGAFLTGTWLGKHRLFPRISPKKSWEGCIGGFIAVIIASLFIPCFLPDYNRYLWIAFGTVTVVAATFGDLFESLLKRSFNAKDSGNILPGHGGMLDRFDSAIFAAPALYIIFNLL